MSPRHPTKFESWQFFHVALKVLGHARMWDIYRKSSRYVQQCGCKPSPL